MTTVLTPNLRLRIDSKLTSNAKYNLQRIDLLGATFLVDSTNTLRIRSQTDILIDPNSPDLNGEGQGNVIVGDASRKAASFRINADEIIFNGAFNLLDQAAASTGKLGLVYKSDINGSSDNTARVLNIDVDGADRNLVLGGNLSLIGNDLILNATGPTDITLPETGTLSTLAGEETLTNKTIDAEQNTLSNISNTEIKYLAGIEYSKLELTDSITNDDISSESADRIEYSKLDLANSIVDADINEDAAIAYGKLDLADSVTNLDISSDPADRIEYSKLDLADQIVDADISTTAAISYSKLDLDASITDNDIDPSSPISYSNLDIADSITDSDVSVSADIAYSKLNLEDSIVDGDIAAAAAISGTKIVPDFGAQDIRTEGVLELSNGTYLATIQPGASTTENITFRLPDNNGADNAVLATDGAGNLRWSSSGTGSVTRVGLTVPTDIFSVSPAEITTQGDFEITKANQAANQVYAGPETGADAEPTFRSLVLADLPAITPADIGLGNVDDTSDLDKPVSTATQSALDNKQDTLGFTPEDSANRGQPDGYAPLNALGKLDGIYLDSPVSSVNGETGDVTVNAISELTGDVTAGPASGSESKAATIAAGAITDSKVSTSAAIAVSKLATGTNGQVLQVVAGVPSWGAAPVSVESFKADWVTADGTTKAITHSLGTSDVLIQIFDKSNGQSVEVDSIIRSSINAVSLTASQAPGASGWRVLILAI
jgi:hypothetical protein